MEDALAPESEFESVKPVAVLILVVMEDALAHWRCLWRHLL